MEQMKSSEIRQRFLDFFLERDHRLYKSSSLIPHNDPTVLLTTAGMQQFINYFTGQETPPAPRARSAPRSASAPRISRRSATRATSPSSRCSATSPSGTTSRKRP